MGYSMTQRAAIFNIKKENVEPCLKAIKSLATQTNKGRGSSWSGGVKTSASFAWVRTEEFANASTLKEAIEAWGWHIGMEKDEVTEIYFDSDKSGDERHLFDAMAPYVESGSFIEMSGEDDYIWRWKFDGRKCMEEGATLDWENNIDIVQSLLKKKSLLPLLIGIHPMLDTKIAKVLGKKKE